MATVILTAQTIITMDEAHPRAEAVAIDGDTIVAVGSLDECRDAYPDADVVDTGVNTLAPGFIDPHSHPLWSGIATQSPARSIAPWDAPTWDDVLAIFRDAIATTDPSIPLLFNGFDALLLGQPAPGAAELDAIFGDRVAVVADNSGHASYFTSALIAKNGWDTDVPADPTGGRFGRHADGSLDGRGYEVPVNAMILTPILSELGGNPIFSGAQYYALMATGGITSTSDMTFDPVTSPGYEILATLPSCPLRVSMWQMSTTKEFSAPVSFTADEKLLIKQGVKLWTDGSPWVGNVGISFPYLDTHATELGGIDKSLAGQQALNYPRDTVDAILDECAPLGWQMSFHSNGDLAVDFALDAYERALYRHDLIGTDHRWRLEHVGAARRDQFERAARLGVHISMAPFQYYYWGDLLDGQMFDSEFGSRWQAFRPAFDSGACVTFHNDGAVSLPTPILNMQTAVTRMTRSGTVHRPELGATIDEAMRAHTINAAMTLHREALVGSIAVGKLADFVELTNDPYAVDPHTLAETVRVVGTWVGGHRVDLEAFSAAAAHAEAPIV